MSENTVIPEVVLEESTEVKNEEKENLFKKLVKKADDLGINAESISKVSSTVGEYAVKAGKQTATKAGEAASSISESVQNISEKTVTTVKGMNLEQYKLDPEDVLRKTMRIPGMSVDRETFLRKEFRGKYADNVINLAIDRNPAYAGITREDINEFAKKVINYETNKVTTLSFASGLPGGLAVMATVPADIAQYFGHIIITMQKLAYLYGFESFELDNDSMSDDNLNTLMIFMGIMFGVNSANTAIKVLSETLTSRVSKTLAQKALTKTTLYPIVKKISTAVGIKMTKDVFAKGVTKVIPILGGVVSGGITYVTFKPGCIKLQNSFSELDLSDTEFYKDIIDVDIEI